MKKVYSAENLIIAGHVRALLQQAGIECVIQNQNLAGAAGELPPFECWPEIWIYDDADYDQAMAVIEQGLAGDTSAGAWRCTCGEQIEGQFSQCWRCGAERPVDDR